MKANKKLFCIFLTGMMMLAAGCQKDQPSNVNYYDENNPAPTQAPVQDIQADVGEEAEFSGMKLTLISVEDPGIIMEQSGKSALFFEVKIDNQTEDTVTANYLNNFSLLVDGTEYTSDVCCTIPVMKKLYDLHNVEAMNEEIPAGESRTGYIACEADQNFSELSLQYTPKTTDRESKITVAISKEDIVKAKS